MDSTYNSLHFVHQKIFQICLEITNSFLGIHLHFLFNFFWIKFIHLLVFWFSHFQCVWMLMSVLYYLTTSLHILLYRLNHFGYSYQLYLRYIHFYDEYLIWKSKIPLFFLFDFPNFFELMKNHLHKNSPDLYLIYHLTKH